VVDHPSAFDFRLYEGRRNEGGREENYSVKIELDRTVPSSTDLRLDHLHAIPVAWGCAQVQGSE
jgi:hypothetical protein